MINMLDNVKALYKEIEEFELTDSNSLESFRLEFLSKNGKIKSLFKKISDVPVQEKATFGKEMKKIQLVANDRFEVFNAHLKTQIQIKPLRKTILLFPHQNLSALHPLTQTLNEMKIFSIDLVLPLMDQKSKMTL